MNLDDRDIHDSQGPPIEHDVYYNRTLDEWSIGYIDEDTGFIVVRRTAKTRTEINRILWKEFNI